MRLYRCRSCDPHVSAITLSVMGTVIKAWCGSCGREASSSDPELMREYLAPF